MSTVQLPLSAWMAGSVYPPKKIALTYSVHGGGCEPYCFLLTSTIPLLSVLLPSSSVSHVQIFQSYDEMLTSSLHWAVSFPGLLCWAGIPMTDPMEVAGRVGKCELVGECEPVEETKQRDNMWQFPSLQLEIDVKSPGHKLFQIKNPRMYVLSCLPLYS